MTRRFRVISTILALLLVLIGALPSCSAAKPGEPYKIGVMAAITGPLAATSDPFTQGFIAYMTDLNGKGGIGGHKVELMVEDDRGEAAAGAANVKKLIEQGAMLIYNTSLSATFAPTVAEVRKANIPAIFAVVAPDEALPPNPDPLIFALGSRYATPTTSVTAYIAKYLADKLKTGPVKLGILGTELPISKKNVDNIVSTNTRFGIETMGKVIPLNTADISLIAQAFKEWGANWIHVAAPGPYNGMLYDGLKKIDWKVNFVDQTFIQPFEPTMDKYKGDANYFDASEFIPFFVNLPEHKEIQDALKKQNITTFHSGIIQGWMDGKVIATALSKSGWPLKTDKLLSTMQNLQVDLSPLMGPSVWTSKDHVGSSYWKVYHWEGDKIVAATPWVVTDVMGQDIKTMEELPKIK